MFLVIHPLITETLLLLLDLVTLILNLTLDIDHALNFVASALLVQYLEVCLLEDDSMLRLHLLVLQLAFVERIFDTLEVRLRLPRHLSARGARGLY